MARARRSGPAGVQPLSPRRKWRAILLGTLLLAPAFWAIVIGLVAGAAEDANQAPSVLPFVAFGLCLVPFVFIVLAFSSEHPRAPGAVVRAMALSLLVGIPVSALAGDAVTGLVAGLGAGGVAALRADVQDHWKARALAVLAMSAYVFVTIRAVPELALLVAPALPFTALGIADHLAETRRRRLGGDGLSS